MASVEEIFAAARFEAEIKARTIKIMARCSRAADASNSQDIPEELRQLFMDAAKGIFGPEPIEDVVAAYVERELRAGRNPE